MNNQEIECPECEGLGQTYISCCGYEMDHDILMCPKCHEHWEPETCETCNGTGKIKIPTKEDYIAFKQFTATHDYLNKVMRELELSEYDKYIFIQGWDEAIKFFKLKP